MSNEIIKHQTLPVSATEAMQVGKMFFESGLFTDLKSAAQAVTKIMAGSEIGIPPFAAMNGIHIILGKPVMGAGLIASKVKSSGKYDYKVKEMSDSVCSIDFYQGKEMIGNSSFNIQDAKKAGTKNLDKFPKNMLFARAISNGVKWFCPDVFNGPVYTPEDFNTDNSNDVNETHEAEINDVPTGEERQLLVNLLNQSDLNEDERITAFEMINTCSNYKKYETLQHRLEYRKLSIENIQNPSQKDLNAHLKKVV